MRIILVIALALCAAANAANVSTIPLLKGERWYGGIVNRGFEQPYDETSKTRKYDLAVQCFGGATMPFLVSDKGRYVWSERPFAYQFKAGELMVESETEKISVVQAGGNLREAYLAASKRHFPFAGMPPRELFEKPQFNNWIEMYIRGMNQQVCEEYADEIVSNKFPCGVHMVDGGWMKYHGAVEFNPDTYPDPKRLFKKLHDYGWKSMLWFAYFVSPDSRNEYRKFRYYPHKGRGGYSEGMDYLVHVADPKKRDAAVLRWWSGISCAYDLTNPKVMDYFVGRIKGFANEYGIDGFKFDAGDPEYIAKSDARLYEPWMKPCDYSKAWNEVGLSIPYHEYRSGFKTGGKPIVQRLHDQPHKWEAQKAIIRDVITAGLMGYPYVIPDMVGGGLAGSFAPGAPFDAKLMVRSCQMQMYMPMVQFSLAPWRVLPPRECGICRQYAEMRVKQAPYIMDLVKHASETGEPIVRSMDYEFPGEGFEGCDTQFMLGWKLLVAPVLTPDDKVTVRLPAGEWIDDAGKKHVGPKVIELTDVPLWRVPRYVRNSWVLENEKVRAEICADYGRCNVTDKRTGTKRMGISGEKSPTASARVIGARMKDRVLELEMAANHTNRTISIRYALDASKPEIGISFNMSGNWASDSWAQFPLPLENFKGEWLIAPLQEGMAFPVDEKPYAGQVSRYFYGGNGLSMAWYGACNRKTGEGWQVIVETPDDATLAVRIGGKDMAYTYGVNWLGQLGKFAYPRKVRLVMHNRGGYVAMCKRYREHAKGIGILKTFAEKEKTRPLLDRLYGAVNIWAFGKSQIELARDVRAYGIDRFLWSGGKQIRDDAEVREIASWPNVLMGRYDIFQDVNHPEQMKKLNWRTGLNIKAWPEDIVWTSESSNDWQRAWGTKAKDGSWTYAAAMCDLCAPKYARQRIAESLATRPYSAYFYDTTTASTWRECRNPKHPCTRSESKAARIELMNTISGEKGLVAGSETGIDSAIPVCDYFEGMLSPSHFRLPDAGRDMTRIWTNDVPEHVGKYMLGERYRVPLWELTFHECACAQWYWGDYNNKMPKHWDKRDLFNVLYATMPMFMFNRQTWEYEKTHFLKTFRTTSPIARECAKSEMVDHEVLSEDFSRQRSTFANGVEVTVDFKSGTYEVKHSKGTR